MAHRRIIARRRAAPKDREQQTEERVFADAFAYGHVLRLLACSFVWPVARTDAVKSRVHARVLSYIRMCPHGQAHTHTQMQKHIQQPARERREAQARATGERDLAQWQRSGQPRQSKGA